MTIIDVNPFINRSYVLEFGTDDYAKAVSAATLTPSTGLTTHKGLKPGAVWTFPQAVTHTLDLEFSQDWSSDTSLSAYLYDHQGETVPMTLNVNETPTGGTTVFTFDAVIAPGSVGGPVDAVAVSTVQLGVLGTPVRTFTPGTPA